MELREAFARLESEEKLAIKFVDDPEGVLEVMGVDTANLVIQPVVGAKEPLKAIMKGRRGGFPAGEPAGLTVCASVGYIVCVSVGGEVGLAASEAFPEARVAAKSK